MHALSVELVLKVSLELAIAEFVALFVLAVVLPCLLNGIISEMDIRIE